MRKILWNDEFIKQDFLGECFIVNSNNGDTFTLNSSGYEIIKLVESDTISAYDLLIKLGGKDEDSEDLEAIEEFITELLDLGVLKSV